jgi:hypothetical protein
MRVKRYEYGNPADLPGDGTQTVDDGTVAHMDTVKRPCGDHRLLYIKLFEASMDKH